MISLLDWCTSIYQNDRATTLFKWLQKIHPGIYYKLIHIRRCHSLTLNGQTIVFSAPTPTMVKRNRLRFKSEKQELADFVNEIERDDVVYDIGANTGLYSLFAAKKCIDGKVIAFEPYPPNIRQFKHNLSRNQLQNIDIIDVALSDSIGRIEFNQPEESDIGYGSSSIEAEASEATIDVPTTTGDQLIANDEIPEPNVVKIDVEGAESLVIEGLKNALSTSRCRLVYCEIHLPGVDHRPSVEDFGSSQADLRTQLEGMGFEVRRMHTRGEEEVFIKARK